MLNNEKHLSLISGKELTLITAVCHTCSVIEGRVAAESIDFSSLTLANEVIFLPHVSFC